MRAVAGVVAVAVLGAKAHDLQPQLYPALDSALRPEVGQCLKPQLLPSLLRVSEKETQCLHFSS
jgi:hypothetical protein